MSLPWETDRALDAEGVRRVVGAQLPELAGEPIRPLGSGWDYDAWLVGASTVLRFPRRAEVADRLVREEAILELVSTSLGGAVRVPRITVRGRSGVDFPHAFFGHALIPGRSGDDPTVPHDPDLAIDLGIALTLIHSIPRAAAVGVVIPEEVERPAERLAETIGLVKRCAAVREMVPAEIDWLLHRAGPAPIRMPEPRFLHNDLCPDHVLVDPASGRLSGIIDWSDAAFGDPVLDFVGLVLWRGWGFARAVRVAYGLDVDDQFEDRLAFLSRVSSLKWLTDAIDRGGDVDKHLRWVRNAAGRGDPGRSDDG